MESRPQNPEFRNYPENFHAYVHSIFSLFSICMQTFCAPLKSVACNFMDNRHIMCPNIFHQLAKVIAEGCSLSLQDILNVVLRWLNLVFYR